MTRNDVIQQAVDQCLKELYSYAQPKVSWEDFMKEAEAYSNKYKVWKNYTTASSNKEKNPELWLQYQATFKDWENKSIEECIGPRPFEFYFLPADILKDICDNYVYAYQFDSQQELLNTIQILKDYCRKPIIDKWIESKDGNPGYRSYDHPDNLEKELFNLIPDTGFDKSQVAKEVQDKFFEFLDMAGNFYNWNRDLNTFNMSVYLGPSPNSNKEAVIKNWKKYRDKDIEINEEQIKNDYYDENE